MVNVPLLLTNVIGIFSIAVCFGMGLFLLVKSSRRAGAVSFFLMTLSIVVFYISHLWGINATDQHTAYVAFMFNLVNIFIVCFDVHFVLESLDLVKKRRSILVAIYVVGALLLGFYLAFPSTFMLLPVAKLYLPFYYVPGAFYWVMRVYFVVVALYIFTEIALAIRSAGQIMKNRLKYIFVAHLYGYLVGSLALFLVYNISFDPLWSMFFGFFTFPLAYGIFRYNILDIRVIARQALFYASGVGVVSILIVLINVLNTQLVESVPHFPPLLIPFLSSCLGVAAGFFVWKKVREVDALKYQFINVVTHKFRTPVTRIKWATDALKTAKTDPQTLEYINAAQSGSAMLLELTQILTDVAGSENASLSTMTAAEDLSKIAGELVEEHAEEARKKGLELNASLPAGLPKVRLSHDQIKFALRILLDNAFTYTPTGGKVLISVQASRKSVECSVHDSGIGIEEADLPYVFSRFFRGSRAHLMNVDGLGVALHIARNVVRRNGGDISVESGGPGKGTGFIASFRALD